jgi:RNA polymerase sigma-70 factor (ECF subfamily)
LNQDPEIILDELLVLKCRRGDAIAWKQLVERYQRRLFYFIRRLVDSERDAWDVLQQTWLGALKSIHGLIEPRTLRTWLYRIARNNAVSHLRKSLPDIAQSVDPADLRDVPDDATEETEQWPADAVPRLHEALAQLTVAHREVLTLHFLEDMPIQEIASIVNIAPGTVKSRLHYAKRALRELIDHENQEGPS